VNDVADLVLKLGDIKIILPLFVLGTVFYNRLISSVALCFFSVATVLNSIFCRVFGKSKPFNLGRSFPSEFIHACAAFYGYIFYAIHTNEVRGAAAILVILECIAELRRRSNIWDVAGGLAFAALEVFGYDQALKNFRADVIATAVAVAAITILLMLAYGFGDSPSVSQIRAVHLLVGTLGSLYYFSDSGLSGVPSQVFAVVVIAALIFAAFWLVEQLHFGNVVLSEAAFALIPVIVFGGIALVAKEGHRIPFLK
jgi:hypothetical protein